jgi:hypothetical protein
MVGAVITVGAVTTGTAAIGGEIVSSTTDRPAHAGLFVFAT